ncbi:hypothetical protein C8F04DRAFT_238484 [Mycena alexandri]|uniref:Uncharacterized protein n=1 Tax=Mycena alexandri TaxID=1745969 RepID=A0AAD6T6Y0_9AGAR|nr:hypothetical protein C8F04DRAFT_238484 [Mycena alexandri]
MSFFKKLETLVDRLPEGYQHTRDEIIGLVNPNRRHDDPEEKRQDAMRAEINAGHRFDSFAAERSEIFVKCQIRMHSGPVLRLSLSSRQFVQICSLLLEPSNSTRRKLPLRETQQRGFQTAQVSFALHSNVFRPAQVQSDESSNSVRPILYFKSSRRASSYTQVHH